MSFHCPRILLSCAALALAVPVVAQAQYAGPNKQKPSPTVAQIVDNPRDDQQVVLQGLLTSKVGTEKYMFSDGSGEIRVDIDAKDFHGQQVDDKTRVEIHGEVEKDFLESPEIDVDLIRVVS